MKRMASLLLAAVMCVTMLIPAFAADSVTQKCVSWNITVNGKATPLESFPKTTETISMFEGIGWDVIHNTKEMTVYHMPANAVIHATKLDDDPLREILIGTLPCYPFEDEGGAYNFGGPETEPWENWVDSFTSEQGEQISSGVDCNGTSAPYYQLIVGVYDNLTRTYHCDNICIVIDNALFLDVKEGDWYYDFVKWGVENHITAGYDNGRFGYADKCTRAQILTFMWNAMGKPEPTAANPFSDVKGAEWFSKAAVWAYENGMVEGGSLDPNAPCTRADTVTYLWKLAGKPSAAAASFSDVKASADYANAVNWAAAQGITAGYADGRFGVSDTCTRAQIMTFLYNDLAK